MSTCDSEVTSVNSSSSGSSLPFWVPVTQWPDEAAIRIWRMQSLTASTASGGAMSTCQGYSGSELWCTSHSKSENETQAGVDSGEGEWGHMASWLCTALRTCPVNCHLCSPYQELEFHWNIIQKGQCSTLKDTLQQHDKRPN